MQLNAASEINPKNEVEGNQERQLAPNAVDENRELKVSSNLQLTSANDNNEITIKETSFHQGVAVPMTLEDYEKEIAREKDLVNKAKKKLSVESSTPKDGISTWILLSGSNNPTGRPELKPAFRIESSEKKPARNATMTTKKQPVTTTTKNPKTTPKPVPKYSGTKVITRVKVTSNGSVVTETDDDITTKTPATTKKPQLTTKAKKYTTARPKTTITTTTAASTTTEAADVIDDDNDDVTPSAVETSTFLIMEPKDADFDLPNDREPLRTKSATSKPSKGEDASKIKKKKKTKIAAVSTNSTRIKKKSDKKTTSTKLSTKTPEKPITTQIYNYLAREVMPTVGVGLVGLVVTAGLATYFLGGPLTALRRSYDISNRRDDMAYDRSDDFGGNTQAEEEMFGKVIAGMPENSAYRNNLRVSSYRVSPPAQPYSGYKYSQQSPSYGNAQHLRYRTIDPYQNNYQSQNQNQQYPQYYPQQQQQVAPVQGQAKSSAIDYSAQGQSQQIQQQQPPQVQQNPQITQKVSIDSAGQKFNIDSVDMTTHQTEAAYNNNINNVVDYDEMAQSYFPQQDAMPAAQEVTVEQQKMQEVDNNDAGRSEKITIVQAQSVPSNHKNDKIDLPTPEALTLSHSDEEYQNSIANAIMNQKKQFVVGSVVAENFEESQPSVVPEHGPRRRRRDAIRKLSKSLENNEIDEDEDKVKREAESSTVKAEESSAKVEEVESTSVAHTETSSSENSFNTNNESTTQYPTYNIENQQNNIFHLFRRIIDLKLRLGLNFLQNATMAFQQYLRGVEQRVNTSPLFNPYAKNETTTTESTARKSSYVDTNKVKAL